MLRIRNYAAVCSETGLPGNATTEGSRGGDIETVAVVLCLSMTDRLRETISTCPVRNALPHRRRAGRSDEVRDEKRLFELTPYDQKSASEVIDYTHNKQREFQKTRGRRIFYAADEFYIRAGRPIPPASRYDEFYQLENGVGLLAARGRELRRAVDLLKRSKRYTSVHPKGLTGSDRYLLISGTDSASFIEGELGRARNVLGAVPEVFPVKNRFFGENVTVTGLLTGSDIKEAVLGRIRIRLPQGTSTAPAGVLLPDVTLRAGEDVFLDDMTVSELADGTAPVVAQTHPDWLAWSRRGYRITNGSRRHRHCARLMKENIATVVAIITPNVVLAV